MHSVQMSFSSLISSLYHLHSHLLLTGLLFSLQNMITDCNFFTFVCFIVFPPTCLPLDYKWSLVMFTGLLVHSIQHRSDQISTEWINEGPWCWHCSELIRVSIKAGDRTEVKKRSLKFFKKLNTEIPSAKRYHIKCVCPKCIYWSPKPQHDDIWRQDLWEIIRFR